MLTEYSHFIDPWVIADYCLFFEYVYFYYYFGLNFIKEWNEANIITELNPQIWIKELPESHPYLKPANRVYTPNFINGIFKYKLLQLSIWILGTIKIFHYFIVYATFGKYVHMLKESLHYVAPFSWFLFLILLAFSII